MHSAETADDRGTALPDAADETAIPVDGIRRFTGSGNYAESFGKQWNLFRSTQLDRRDQGQTQSETRFFKATGWEPGGLGGKDVLEIGSGAGRFSRVVLERTRATLWSVDYSDAVEANWANNRSIAPGRFHLYQASIYDLPFPDDRFDKVFCMGVLQHTPDFEASVAALIAKAKPGAEIVVDFYPIKGWWTKVHAKYLLRPFTRRLSHERLLRLIERNVGWMMKLSDRLQRVGLGHLRRFIPLVDLETVVPRQLTAEQRREWAVLDTFDMFSPEYDNPQRVKDVATMFQRHGAIVTFADYILIDNSPSAIVRAIKTPL